MSLEQLLAEAAAGRLRVCEVRLSTPDHRALAHHPEVLALLRAARVEVTEDEDLARGEAQVVTRATMPMEQVVLVAEGLGSMMSEGWRHKLG